MYSDDVYSEVLECDEGCITAIESCLEDVG